MTKLIDDINKYFDEGLASEAEEVFFHKLAQSQEAREIFNQHLRLNIGVFHDATNIAPPIESTAYIFDKLGIALPASNTMNTKIKKGSKKLLIALLILIFASLISIATLGVVEILRGNNAQQTIIENVSKQDRQHKLLHSFFNHIETDNSEVKELGTKGMNKIGQNLSRKQKSSKLLESIYGKQKRDKAMSDKNLANVEENKIILANKNASLDEIGNMSTLSLTRENYMVDERLQDKETKSYFSKDLLTPISNNGNSHTSALEDIYHRENRYTTYRIALNKLFLQNGQIANIEANNALWNNASLSFSYNLSKSHTLGAELGWQDFSQNFSRKIGPNQFKQNQVPMFFYGRFLYSYNFSQLLTLDKLQPYLKLSIGGTSVGPIVGSEIGAYFNIYRNYGLILSGNFDMLFYNVENKIYNSDKFGLKLGAYYGF